MWTKKPGRNSSILSRLFLYTGGDLSRDGIFGRVDLLRTPGMTAVKETLFHHSYQTQRVSTDKSTQAEGKAMSQKPGSFGLFLLPCSPVGAGPIAPTLSRFILDLPSTSRWLSGFTMHFRNEPAVRIGC